MPQLVIYFHDLVDTIFSTGRNRTRCVLLREMLDTRVPPHGYVPNRWTADSCTGRNGGALIAAEPDGGPACLFTQEAGGGQSVAAGR